MYTNVPSSQPGVIKFTIVLEDGHTWFVYASQLNDAGIDFIVVNNGLIKANSNFNGVLQIAKNTGGVAEALYDAAAGAYATTAAVSGSANGNTGSYTLSFTKGGIQATTLMMFCLAHHLESFVPESSSAVHISVQLVTTTKGKATAVTADSWTMNENLPTSMGFSPFTPTTAMSNSGSLSSNALDALHDVALSEVSQDMNAQSNLNSMYYSGKALAKFAQIVYVLNDILNDKTTAQSGLTNLKSAFSRFTSNTQQFPLVYETAWGGVVSSASYTTGDGGADFGNTYYNDHHFQ
jgi:endo-1,3(4)-beta-glucanase